MKNFWKMTKFLPDESCALPTKKIAMGESVFTAYYKFLQVLMSPDKVRLDKVDYRCCESFYSNPEVEVTIRNI